MMFKVIEVQRIGVPRRGEVLIQVKGKGGEFRVEVESFRDASDELFQRDIQTVARDVAMIGEGVDTGTWTTT